MKSAIDFIFRDLSDNLDLAVGTEKCHCDQEEAAPDGRGDPRTLRSHGWKENEGWNGGTRGENDGD